MEEWTFKMSMGLFLGIAMALGNRILVFGWAVFYGNSGLHGASLRLRIVKVGKAAFFYRICGT
jgi:hypothetical protein